MRYDLTYRQKDPTKHVLSENCTGLEYDLGMQQSLLHSALLPSATELRPGMKCRTASNCGFTAEVVMIGLADGETRLAPLVETGPAVVAMRLE